MSNDDEKDWVVLADQNGRERHYLIEDMLEVEHNGESREYLILVSEDDLELPQGHIVRYDVTNDLVEEITDDDEWQTVLVAAKTKHWGLDE